ncbi:MAG: RNA polymerase sigma factor [Clostridia bacterium]|nr:RNA polymerase sigma factor [Clostridia bacterium]
MSNEVDRLNMRNVYVSEYLEKLFYFCLKKTGDVHEAEDLASDISLCVLSGIETREIDNFPAWVWQTAKNRYARWAKCRAAKRASTLADDVSEYDVPSEDGIDDEITHKEDVHLLRRELAFISSEYRKIVVAYYIKQKRISEISKALSIPEGTVKTKLYRARKILKEGLNMAREFGKRSYDPESLYFCASGMITENNPWSRIVKKLDTNIVAEAHNNPSTAEELSVALGVALPYMEEAIDVLKGATLLKQLPDGRYITNFFISPVECQNEINELSCTYAEENYEAIWELAKRAYIKAKELGADLHTISEDDACVYFALRILDQLQMSMFRPGIALLKRENGEEWGFIGFEEGATRRLPNFPFNNNCPENWNGYQACWHDERFKDDLYDAPGGCPEDRNAIATMTMVAEGVSEDTFTIGDRKNLGYLIDKGFCIREDGHPVVHAIVLDSKSRRYIDDIVVSDDYKALYTKMEKLVSDAKQTVTKYANPYMENDLDYYTMMSLGVRGVLACLLKDRGLYTGSSAQFCALYIK